MNDNFPSLPESLPNVLIYWGAADIDRTGDSMWDPDFIGTLNFDETFNLNTIESQNYLRQFCKDLRSQDFTIGVDCWIEDFISWLERSNKQFPSRDFDTDIKAWLNSPGGQPQNVGYRDSRVIFTQVQCKTKIQSWNPSEVKQPEYDKF
jgi:hypothetical protein